ncbi:unnamed protein product [Vitrella brassicaformis CCMP3155]|uniref:Uncharacterized protein n=1 Tax=Vitrella brassicaformis (strain CCMP3155) TaxID=1169540 RepID=A0A0G4GGU9_VITBC|nr:unnamed protein product [Vitrella brassicaformis CCMP3155]|eukprot:CEM28870.1 unnamed protein product [Vitrella brassicaformis CCMP3155]
MQPLVQDDDDSDRPRRWCLYDDSKPVAEFTDEFVLSQQAYMAYYSRDGVPSMVLPPRPPPPAGHNMPSPSQLEDSQDTSGTLGQGGGPRRSTRKRQGPRLMQPLVQDDDDSDRPRRWCLYDDSKPVAEFTDEFVLSQQAYMAYYSRDGVPSMVLPPRPPPPAGHNTPSPSQLEDSQDTSGTLGQGGGPRRSTRKRQVSQRSPSPPPIESSVNKNDSSGARRSKRRRKDGAAAGGEGDVDVDADGDVEMAPSKAAGETAAASPVKERPRRRVRVVTAAAAAAAQPEPATPPSRPKRKRDQLQPSHEGVAQQKPGGGKGGKGGGGKKKLKRGDEEDTGTFKGEAALRRSERGGGPPGQRGV